MMKTCRPLFWVVNMFQGSVSPSTYKLFEGRGVWWRSAELSDRPTSSVYRVPVIAKKKRTHQFTLPGRINSEFTAFRGDRDLCFHPREYLPASQRQDEEGH